MTTGSILMNRDELMALAERVEQASGPDRELDAEITLALGLAGDNFVTDTIPGWVCGGEGNPFKAPTYTSSLDAAMSLAEGLSRFGGPGGMLRWALDRMSALPVMLSQMSSDEFRQTLARYVTAASLRAQVEEMGNG